MQEISHRNELDGTHPRHYNLTNMKSRSKPEYEAKAQMSEKNSNCSRSFLILLGGLLFTNSAHALELDWSGQFRAEYNFVNNYSLDSTAAAESTDAARAAAGGYYIPSGGSSQASFQTLFLRLRPKLVVNDNVYVKSEWWVGNPVSGFFGGAVPYTSDSRQFYSNQSRGSSLTAQRFWAEILTDLGTAQVGRAPLHWGLGLVWNSGEGLWDRYMSTADTVRLVSKFGSFSIVPGVNFYSAGNTVGGASTFSTAGGGTYTTNGGDGGVREYSLQLKYENLDEEVEGGVNFVRRLSGAAQDPNGGLLGALGTAGSSNYNIWDLYAKKRLGRFTIAAEAPVTQGNVSGLDYSTWAVASELGFKLDDNWDFSLKAGRAPGQPNSAGAIPDSFRAFFFNPAYRLGMIMFNYQLANFAGPNMANNPAISEASLRSIYDNPIVNASYLMFKGVAKVEKWSFDMAMIYAVADVAAQSGQKFYNTWSRSIPTAVAVSNQDKSLGFETDLAATLHWDDAFLFRSEFGFFMPGGFYKFSNTATENQTATAVAAALKVGVQF